MSPASRILAILEPTTHQLPSFNSSTVAMRCATCLNLNYEDSRPTTTTSSIIFNTNYHETVAAIRESVRQGCHFCTLVLAGLDTHVLPRGETRVSTPIPDDTPIKLTLYADRSWDRVQGSYVKENGAYFWVNVNCPKGAQGTPLEAVRYKIEATPPPESMSLHLPPFF